MRNFGENKRKGKLTSDHLTLHTVNANLHLIRLLFSMKSIDNEHLRSSRMKVMRWLEKFFPLEHGFNYDRCNCHFAGKNALIIVNLE